MAADIRATIAALRAVREKMTPGPWLSHFERVFSHSRSIAETFDDGIGEARTWNARGIVATHNAADALLDALDRIAAVVDGIDECDGTNDYKALEEIRAILDGAREGTTP